MFDSYVILGADVLEKHLEELIDKVETDIT